MSFLYGFKGAPSAPRAWRRVTAHAATAVELTHITESGRDAPAETSSHRAAATRLTAVAHGGGRQGTDPGQLAAPTGRRNRHACANRAILPARPLLKPSKITVKARLCSQDNQ